MAGGFKRTFLQYAKIMKLKSEAEKLIEGRYGTTFPLRQRHEFHAVANGTTD